MKMLKLTIVLVVMFYGNNAFGQSKYFKAMSKVETEQDAQKLKEKHPQWDISIVELQPIDSVNRPRLYGMVKPNVSSYGSEGKAYKVLEERKKLLLIQFEPTVAKQKKKYDY